MPAVADKEAAVDEAVPAAAAAAVAGRLGVAVADVAVPFPWFQVVAVVVGGAATPAVRQTPRVTLRGLQWTDLKDVCRLRQVVRLRWRRLLGLLGFPLLRLQRELFAQKMISHRCQPLREGRLLGGWLRGGRPTGYLLGPLTFRAVGCPAHHPRLYLQVVAV